MYRAIIVAALIWMFSIASTFAFDGHHKGFVLGGGFGIGPSTKLKVINKYDKNEVGYAMNALIGYAWNDKNMICLEYNANHYCPPLFGSDTAISVFISPVWYHYYGNKDQSLYSVLGLGRHGLGIWHYGWANGLGFLLGGGYEFRKHFQAGMYYSGGFVSSSDYPDHTYYVDKLNVILTIILY